MTEEQLMNIAKRFSGDSVHIELFVEVVCDEFEVEPSMVRRMIIEHLAVGRSQVWL